MQRKGLSVNNRRPAAAKTFGCTGGHIGLHAAADLEISEKELPNKVSLHQSKINDC
jgi:hypothetical protein